jgi:hypothetical protein
MSFKENSCQQLSFSDSFSDLTAREQKALEKSWAKIFADEKYLKSLQNMNFSRCYINGDI